jgi:hypothetical protein
VKRFSFFMIILISCAALFAQDAVSFDFAILSKDAAGKVKNVDFKQDIKISVKDMFQFYVSPAAGYVYIVLIDAQNQVALLYPDYSAKTGFVQIAPKRLPGEGKYFSVDATPGTERFYLLGSKTRRKKVEDLTARWIKASADKKAASELAAIREDLQDELARLVYEAGPYAGGTEKPHSFGGVVRGADSNSELTVSRITSGQIYARTIRLKH